MSLTLGEKLQQAREARGITISEVAEQTRISSLYLEAIENNDYRTLPGGIFNKGFVKSYARYVGVDEHEALADYSQLLTEQQGEGADEMKVYKPEVLTDSNSRSSITTIVFAVIILGLMTWGILALVNYLQETQSTPPANTSNTNPNTNAPASNTNTNPQTAAAPTMENLKVEFKAVGEPIALTSIVDGKTAYTEVAPDKPILFEPKVSLRLSYLKSKNAGLSINGKEIKLPQPPASRSRTIAFEISAANLAEIWQKGEFPADEPAPAATAATPLNRPRPTATVVTTPVVPPARANTNR